MSELGRIPGTTPEFQNRWRAPVAVSDRLGGFGDMVKSALTRYYLKGEYGPVGIGQEAVVGLDVEGGGLEVIKFLPTEEKSVQDRVDVLRGADEFFAGFGSIAMSTVVDAVKAPNSRLSSVGAELIVTQRMEYVEGITGPLLGLAKHGVLPEKLSEGFIEDLGEVIADVTSMLDEESEYLVDIQNPRTDNLPGVFDEETGLFRVGVPIDRSPFVRGGYLHPLSPEIEENTWRVLGALGEWYNELDKAS